jgi:site-specific recombinase XerD
VARHLLYGAGLRISEALALTLADVDLSTGILIIHTSKFCKTRLVPLGSDLTDGLKAYATKREIAFRRYILRRVLRPGAFEQSTLGVGRHRLRLCAVR